MFSKSDVILYQTITNILKSCYTTIIFRSFENKLHVSQKISLGKNLFHFRNNGAKGDIAGKEAPKEMGFSAEKLRQILLMEEANLLLLKKLKASQHPKPPAPTAQPAPPQANSQSTNNVAANNTQTTSNVSSVSTPGVTNTNVTPAISVGTVVTTTGKLSCKLFLTVFSRF